MTKSKRKGKRRGGHGGGPAAVDPAAILDEISAKAAEIAGADPASAGPLWGAVHKLLLKAKADPGEVMHFVATRDADGLGHLVARLKGEEAAAPEAPEATVDQPPAHDIPAETLRHAVRAFRKRLKLTRLDHESRLGVGPMTGGKKADIDAIMPPREFPTEVWEALVAEGRLRRMGQGFYALVNEGTDD